MLRSRERFYWSDALYSAKSRELLLLIDESPDVQIFRCKTCSAIVRFQLSSDRRAGTWQRIKPFEHFQWQKKTQPSSVTDEVLKTVFVSSGSRHLFQCPDCMSFWWREGREWNRADDELVEHQTERE